MFDDFLWKKHLFIFAFKMYRCFGFTLIAPHNFANKGLSGQGYVFPVVMYGCESWTVKKAERWKIDAFEL